MDQSIDTSLIRRHEGLRLEAYRCPAGVWTIGYGHTQGVRPGMRVTAEEAERLLQGDVAAILPVLPPGLHRCQQEALVSFIYNVGTGAWEGSTLRRMVIADNIAPAIRREFMRWVNGGGRCLPGLVKRRQEEADRYFSFRL